MKKVITYGTFDLFHVGHLSVFDFKQREKEVAVLDEKIVDYWR